MPPNSTVYLSESGSDGGKGLPAPIDSFSSMLTWSCRTLTEGLFANTFSSIVNPKAGGLGGGLGLEIFVVQESIALAGP